MKKLLCWLICSLVIGQIALMAESTAGTKALMEIYKASLSDEERVAVLRKMASINDDALKLFYAQALEDLDTRGIETGNAQDKSSKLDLAQALIKVIGDRQVKEAAPTLRRIFLFQKDPHLRGSAALSLSGLGLNDIVGTMREVLGRTNQSTIQNRDEEILASYLVSALGALKSQDAFEAVFAASFGWYSNRSQVKAAALQALPLLSTDMAASLTDLIEKSLDLETKIRALETLAEGNYAPEAQMKGGLMALRTVSNMTPQLPDEKILASSFRKESLLMMSRLKAKNPETPSVIARALNTPLEREEIRLAVRVLGADASDAAVKILSTMLRDFNARQKSSANTESDLITVRELIAALAKAKNPQGKDALTEIEFSLYTPALIRESKLALSELP